MGGGCPRSTCIDTQQPGTVTNLCTHSGTSPLIHMSGLLVLEYLLSNVPSKIPAYASVNLHEATLEVGGRGQQWAKGFAKQQQAKALHIPKGRPLASSYTSPSQAYWFITWALTICFTSCPVARSWCSLTWASCQGKPWSWASGLQVRLRLP